jgi:hypothetical protein
MPYFYASRTAAEDRDFSRAASERYLMVQALSRPELSGIRSKAGWAWHLRNRLRRSR